MSPTPRERAVAVVGAYLPNGYGSLTDAIESAILAAESEARESEREACEQICHALATECTSGSVNSTKEWERGLGRGVIEADACREMARRIRARGGKEGGTP